MTKVSFLVFFVKNNKNNSEPFMRILALQRQKGPHFETVFQRAPFLKKDDDWGFEVCQKSLILRLFATKRVRNWLGLHKNGQILTKFDTLFELSLPKVGSEWSKNEHFWVKNVKNGHFCPFCDVVVPILVKNDHARHIEDLGPQTL